MLVTGLVGLAPVSLGDPFPANLELSSLDGTNGFNLSGVAAGDRSGRSVSNAGDVNGDGVEDLPYADQRDPKRAFSGASYVVFGGAGGGGAIDKGRGAIESIRHDTVYSDARMLPLESLK